MKFETFAYAVDIYEKKLNALIDVYESQVNEITEMDKMGFFSDAWAAIRIHHID